MAITRRVVVEMRLAGKWQSPGGPAAAFAPGPVIDWTANACCTLLKLMVRVAMLMDEIQAFLVLRWRRWTR